MQLETDNGSPIANPEPIDVERAVFALADRDDGFIILSRDDTHYLQATPDVIEYRDGEPHYRHTMPAADVNLQRDLFLSYFHDDGKWRTLVPWQNATHEIYGPGGEVRRCSQAVMIARIGLAFAVILTIAILWMVAA